MTQITISVVFGLAWAAAMFWTANLLDRRLRRGGYVALAFTFLSLLASSTGTSLAFLVLSLIVLGSIWRDLN